MRRPLPSRSRRAPSLTVKEPSRHPLPLRSRRAVPRHRGAVAPSIAVEEPSRRTLPSRSRRPCRLTTPATPHAPPRWLLRCLSSRGRLPSAGASHCGITFCASRPWRTYYGCHFHEFPCMCSQVMLAMCTLAGIQFPGNNNLGRGGKG
jgi:hypothetical protein